MIRRKDLRFQKGKGFKVVQFTDLHLGDPAQDAKTQEVMANVLAAEPDTALVVLTGDIISGWEWDRQTEGWAEERWKRLVQPLIAAGKPYAIVLGNHDREADLSPREVITLDQRCSELSLSQHGTFGAAGSGDYWLSILPSDGGAAEAARIWFLDSVATPWWWTLLTGQCANDVQLRWLTREGHYALKRGVQQLAFTHVPLPEYISLWNTRPTVGVKGEAVCCRSYHRGLFGALKQAGVSAVYCGHDHVNDYVGTLDGVRLAYGQKTGVAGYGGPCGARVVVLQEGQDPAESLTYLRMADGSRRDQAPSTKSCYWSRSPALPTGAGLLALIALPLWAVCTLRAKDATEAIFTDVGLQVDWVSHTTRSVMIMVAVVTPLVAVVVAANILLACKWQRSGTRAPGTGTATYPRVLAQAMIVTDWLLLLAVAFTMSGMVTWLWDMVQANSALGGDPVLPGLEEAGDDAAAAGLGVWPLPDFGAKTHTVVVHLLPAMVGIVAVFCAVSWLLMYQVATWVRAQCMAEQATAAQGNGLDAPLLNTSISLA